MAKILIIDDSVPIRKLLKELLAIDAHEIVEAVNGDEGVAMSRQTIPDLIILDMNMPKMTGWDVAPLIRSHPKTKRIPILALTADTSTESREKAHDAGCDRYIGKPIDAARLLKAVNALLPASDG